ncbi:hypothetical protein LMG31886_10150 [Xanthomonas hydrangeae]|nr:hypothetical protein LMG31885_05350 [Xanthomonas hydrangeae]CAD7723043.1 hypothetical protein LMG31885_05350 [Xanthomonas hydrangeae]CAD7727254.1 hypothetical protein LMG31886_10150 [Xanthomonas hydrangeae]CAD7727258.1 hypothetical protein LMG31886_10150 [Xanthomonas hydrangeae]
MGIASLQRLLRLPRRINQLRLIAPFKSVDQSMDTMESLRAFLRVAELGSFTRAAETLGLPKARVGRDSCKKRAKSELTCYQQRIFCCRRATISRRQI